MAVQRQARHLPDGFPGQKMIVLPDSVVAHYTARSPFDQLFVTDIGFYPRARYHFRQRDKGTAENILIYCIDGEGWFRTPFGKKKVTPNHWFIIPAGMPHSYGAHQRRPWSIYWVHFVGSAATSFVQLPKFDSDPRPVEAAEEHHRLAMFDEMYAALASGYSKENIGVMCMDLWRFLGSFLYCDRYRGLFNREQMQPFDSIINYMKSNIHRRLTIKELAQKSNFSTSHFLALFKKNIGYSPFDYLLHLKMQKACQLLDMTAFQIKEIAGRIGYDDPLFFSRIFKKVMGVSPQHYREKARG